MAIQIIPTSPGAAYYSEKTRLDGRDYILRFAWNQREERWYFSLFDEEEQPIIQSVKVICNWPFLRYYRSDPRVPPGELMATDLTGNNTPPGFEELGEGRRVEFVYVPSEDLQAVE